MSNFNSPLSLSLNELKGLVARIKSGEIPHSNLIPISTTTVDDTLSPITAYLRVRRGPYSFLIESIFEAEHIDRLTFIGTEPFKVTKFPKTSSEDPLTALEQELSKYKLIPLAALNNVLSNVPGWSFCEDKFMGGAFGFVGYDAVRHFEERVQPPKADVLDIPESLFMFFDSFVVYDNVYRSAILVSLIYLEDPMKIQENEIENAYNKATARLEELRKRVADPCPPYPEEPEEVGASVPDSELDSNLGKDKFLKVVENLKSHIGNGDIIQVVPSHRVTRRARAHPFNIYRESRALNPSPYMFYVDVDDFQIVGTSPECLVRVDYNGVVNTHPIAGTRPRGKNKILDKELEKELLADEKERAEHIMLVDLGRNDVNRVAVPETVSVDTLMGIERYSHVMHIVSKVTGTLRESKTPYDAFRSIFPAGTLSGAPKVRAMQLISEAEPDRRGIYGGAVGYASFNRCHDWCIAIRTMVVKNGHVYIQAGAGVVYDSVPINEWNETVVKIMGPLRAAARAEAAVNTKQDKSRPLYSVRIPRDHSEASFRPVLNEGAARKTASSTAPVLYSAKTDSPVNVLMIDNYDSFTFNLYQYICQLGARVQVHRNDRITLDDCVKLRPTHIVISPGPGHPIADSGVSIELIKHFAGKIPILGVCLGHQAIIALYNGVVSVTGEIKHGKTSLMDHDRLGVFHGIPSPFNAIRYHSLAGEKASFPHEVLDITATSESGIIMGVRHKTFTLEGVQFHPESVKSEHGLLLISNFLKFQGGLWSDSTNARFMTPVEAKNPKKMSISRCIAIMGRHGSKSSEQLNMPEVTLAVREIMSGAASPAQISSFLTGLNSFGYDHNLIHHLSEILLECALPALLDSVGEPRPTEATKSDNILATGGITNSQAAFNGFGNGVGSGYLDIVGTGGDGLDSFNVSSASALVAAACGARVTKAGGRSSSGSVGSADFYECLGAKIEANSEDLARCLSQSGFAFLFGAHFHPSMKQVAPVRRELPVRTVFNVLGPLINPARPAYQVLGVGDHATADRYVQIVCLQQKARGGDRRTIVITGQEGIDEVHPSGKTEYWVVEGGQTVMTGSLTPEDLGVSSHPIAKVCGGSVHERCSIFKAVLNHEDPHTLYGTLEVGAVHDFIVINTAVALYAAKIVETFKEGAELAKLNIKNGNALRVVESYVRASKA